MTSPRIVPQANASSRLSSLSEKLCLSDFVFSNFPRKDNPKKTGIDGKDTINMLRATCPSLELTFVST